MIELCVQQLEGIWFAIALDGEQIMGTSFGSNRLSTQNDVLNNLTLNQPYKVLKVPSLKIKSTLLAIKNIYDGKETNEKFYLYTAKLPAYTQRVLKAVRSIPTGYVASYGGIAEAIGGGPRAVGNAMACNIFPLIIPCHRVVKSDLSLGGYGAGGLRIKFEFLSREKRGYVEPKVILANGRQLKVFPVEYVLERFDIAQLRKS